MKIYIYIKYMHLCKNKKQIKVTDSGQTCPLQGEMFRLSHGEFALLAAGVGGAAHRLGK